MRQYSGLSRRVSVSIAVTMIRSYQVLLSPVVGGACRFTPSCSEYAVEALKTRGTARGLALAIRRISRCNPYGGSGFDPVPSQHAALPDR
jgi:putative membrane protein insertion efficiency factor